MPRFVYIVRDKTGRKITGNEEAVDADELTSRLQANDLIVINILAEPKDGKPASGAGQRAEIKFRARHKNVTSDDMVLLCRQLATLLGAGVTILQSLRVIAKQVSSKQLDEVLGRVAEDMERGLGLHEAMSRHPKIFSELWVNLVESGEASGSLAVVLTRLASYLERNAEFKSKVISSLIYPVILLLVSVVALLFLTIKIIPTFASLFASFHMKLPFITRILISVSAILRRYFLIGLTAIIVSFVTFRRYTKGRDGRKKYESFLYTLPYLGELFRALVVERFTAGMATLIESGVPILYALEISERSVGSLYVGDIINKVKEDVRDGKTLSHPLEKSGFFDPLVVQMVAIGEEIGELASMLKRINTFYQQYVDTFLERFTAMFEPLMLVFIGLTIGFMVVGMFLPIFQITQIR